MMLPQPSGGFDWLQAAGGPALACLALQPRAAHVFTTQNWSLGSRPIDDRAAWSEVARAIGVERDRLARLRQVHGARVVVRRRGEPGARALPEADVIVTDDPSLGLAIQTADCVPLLVADTRRPVVGAAHAGWRGLAAGVPRLLVDALGREFGSRPADLVAAIGPSIGACCYEVGIDVVTSFRRAGFAQPLLERWFTVDPHASDRNPSIERVLAGRRPAHWFFDCWSCTRDQLAQADVAAPSVHAAELCTASHPGAFCSYRRDGVGAGRLAAAIRIASA